MILASALAVILWIAFVVTQNVLVLALAGGWSLFTLIVIMATSYAAGGD